MYPKYILYGKRDVSTQPYVKCTKQGVEVKHGLNQRYVLWNNECSTDINIYAVLWNMHTSKPWDCGDQPLNKLKVI